MIVDHPSPEEPGLQAVGVATALIGVSDLEGALRSLGSAPRAHVLVSLAQASTLGQIGRAQALAGREKEARQSINRALEVARTAAEPPKPEPVADPKPTTPGGPVSMTFLIGQVLSASGKVMPSTSEAESAKIGLAELQAMAGETQNALKTMRELAENQRGFALRRIVSARAAAGDVAGALDLATREARTSDERRRALEGFGQGVDARLKLDAR
jgi:hypothetical protein